MKFTIRGRSRGHIIYWQSDEEAWRYEDGAPYDDSRPCAKCSLPHEPGGPDPCVGFLPGMKSVCCGHGFTEDVIAMPVPRLVA